MSNGRIGSAFKKFIACSKKLRQKGMTLMEIMIVLIILGVIAGLSIPSFIRAMENSRSNEARVNLGIIHMGQRVFRANASPVDYYDSGGAVNITNPVNAVNTGLSIDIQGNFYPSVDIQSPNANNYTASMTRAAVGWTFTVDQTGIITCAPAGACPCNPCN